MPFLKKKLLKVILQTTEREIVIKNLKKTLFLINKILRKINEGKILPYHKKLYLRRQVTSYNINYKTRTHIKIKGDGIPHHLIQHYFRISH